jgi:hypothetical protein
MKNKQAAPAPLSDATAQDLCGAQTSEGNVCRKPAGWGTTHLGQGRCRFHDGAGAAPVEVKNYLVAQMDNKVKAHAEKLLADPDLINCRYELAVLRAHFADIAFQETYDEEGSPTFEYLNNLVKLGATITKMAKDVHELEVGKHHYLHVSVTGALIGAFAEIGRAYITDPYERQRFEEDIEGVIRKSLRGTQAREVAASTLAPSLSPSLGAPVRAEDLLASSEPLRQRIRVVSSRTAPSSAGAESLEIESLEDGEEGGDAS